MVETLTVTQYDERLKKFLSSSPALSDLYVVGEISELKTAASGHLYFTIKDGNATLRCTMWKSRVYNLTFKPQIGMKVTAFGGADFYAPTSSLSFNVLNLALFGEGEQKRALEELTNKLLKEGLFDAERKRKPTKYPRIVGVVTSPTGAVIKDIIETMKLRFPADILLAPALVQGEGAEASIVKGIESLNAYGVDVIIVGRGGGSKEDLSVFNTESLVRAIAASKAPVISAVGHGTDKSLTDRVADVYADTPTQAAVFASADIDEVRGVLRESELRVKRVLSSVMNRTKLSLQSYETRLASNSPEKWIERCVNSVEMLSLKSINSIKNMMSEARNEFNHLDSKLKIDNAVRYVGECGMHLDNSNERAERAVTRKLENSSRALESLSNRLDSLDPYKVLTRGYCYISDSQGNTVTSASSLSKGAVISVKMRDGGVKAEVKEVVKR